MCGATEPRSREELAMAEEEKGELEVTNPVLGSLRAKGYRLMDLVCILTASGVLALAYFVQGYASDYEKNQKAVKEALKESNAEVVKVLKEMGTQHNEVMRQVTVEIRRGNEAQRETACLLDPALRNRPDARDVCKRLIRGERDR